MEHPKEMHLAILKELRLVCSSADLMAMQMGRMMVMDWALLTVIGSVHMLDLLTAMSLVHSTDVPTVKLMVLMMEMHLEQPMVRRLVHLTEIL